MTRPATTQAATPVRDSVGLGLAVGISGLAFGAAAVGSGLSVWQACALSVLAFSGASQFALIGAVAVGGNLIAATAGAVVLGSRNTLYGLRLTGLLRLRGARRLLGALGVIDETTAVTLAQPDQASGRTAFGATFACLYLTWNLATLAGALGAGSLASPRALGLDVVGPAAFLALIWPRLRDGWTERATGAAGAAIALGLTTVLPPGIPVILAATAALGAALLVQVPPAAPGSGLAGAETAGAGTAGAKTAGAGAVHGGTDCGVAAGVRTVNGRGAGSWDPDGGDPDGRDVNGRDRDGRGAGSRGAGSRGAGSRGAASGTERPS